jgi:5,10-methylenetetrahydromethanopterin reductase
VANLVPHIGLRLHGGLTARQCVELAVAGDRNGFSTAWFAENAFARGSLPAAAACAVATGRLMIGAGVFNPFSRHPSMMAMEIGALDELSDGRAMLGIGAGIGSSVQKIGSPSDKPLAAVRDTLAILRPLLRGEQVTYVGRSFSALEVKLDYKPRADIPIYVAGRGDLTLKLAGESADGLIISNMCAMDFAARSATVVTRGWNAAGRVGSPGIVQYMPCAVHRDRAEAQTHGKRAVGEMVPNYWNLSRKIASAREALFSGTGIAEAEFEAAAVRISAGEDPARVLDDKFTRAFSLTGTPDECLARAADYAAAGITELALTFDGMAAAGDIKLLGDALKHQPTSHGAGSRRHNNNQATDAD